MNQVHTFTLYKSQHHNLGVSRVLYTNADNNDYDDDSVLNHKTALNVYKIPEKH